MKITSQTKQLILHLLRRVNHLIAERTLACPNERVMVTVSGGQDSACLIYLLQQLQPKWSWCLGVVHCDHAWNSSSKTQSMHVSKLAAKMKIDCYQSVAVYRVNQEGTARTWRYNQFSQIATIHNYTIVATAHTASDRVETLLHHLVRGSGADGLQSLGWKRRLSMVKCVYLELAMEKAKLYFLPLCYTQSVKLINYKHGQSYTQLIRPLLSTTRSELSLLRHQWATPVWPDSTNHDLALRRNHIRQQFLPYLKHYFEPRIDQTLARWTELVHAESNYLDRIAIQICQQKVRVARFHHAYFLHADIVRALPLALQRRVVKQFLQIFIDRSLTFRHIEEVRLVCLMNSTNSKAMKPRYKAIERVLDFSFSQIYLPNNVILQLADQTLVGLKHKKYASSVQMCS